MRSALVLLALAGCLDPASPPPSSEPPAPRLMKSQPPSFDVEGARPPAREPVDTDARFEADVELRAPVRDGRLSLVPLVTDPVGITLLIGGGMLFVIGIVWLTRVVKVDA
jgi:hypothetical protein